MKVNWKSLLLVTLLVISGPALADQSLKSALGLDVEQARKVDMIESKYRKPYSRQAPGAR
jgi:hypothetical protein